MNHNYIQIVGFDPSTSNWGIVEAQINVNTLEVTVKNLILSKTKSETKKGVIKQSDDLRRAKEVMASMNEACDGKVFAISEIPFMNPGSYASANFNSGLVTGVLASCPIPLIQVSPQEVKMAAVGHRQAAKEEMIEWAMNKHPDANWLMRKLKGKLYPTKDNEHLADALAAIYAGMQTEQFKQAISIHKSFAQSHKSSVT